RPLAERIERVPVRGSPERMSRLAERVEARRGHWRGVGAEAVGSGCLRNGNAPAARPCRGEVFGGNRQRAQLTIAIHDGTPHRLAVVEAAGVAVLSWGRLQQSLQVGGGRHIATAFRAWRTRRRRRVRGISHLWRL